ncbi:hypothetical protein PUN28_012967 [Cardiocondyla obscurior]|uniref:Uncharacterized protein n=1 Tax=Cardiocondyla obscurior TaxID=286306 RepID=A0AAW2F5W9_9HYME
MVSPCEEVCLVNCPSNAGNNNSTLASRSQTTWEFIFKIYISAIIAKKVFVIMEHRLYHQLCRDRNHGILAPVKNK